MLRYEFIALFLSVFICVGCSTLFVPQQLSENYALTPGVVCNAPGVVDGNLNTASSEKRIVISLPEKKSISKIVVHSPNVSNFIVYEFLGNEGQWKIIESVKGNKLPKVVIDTHVITDKLRFFITDTRGVDFADPGTMRDEDGLINMFSRRVDATPQVQEIEIYGLVDKIKTDEPLF
jgi:hypothetical protein